MSALGVERRQPTGGDPAEAFILLHGFGASSFTWRPWLSTLSRHGRAVLVDLKGFGGSRKPDDGRYGPHDQAALVDELVRDDAADRITLVGHSYGGGICLLTALAMARRGDQRLRRMVLVAPAAYRQRLPPFVTAGRFPRVATIGIRLLGARRIIRWAFRQIVVDPAAVSDAGVEAYAAALTTKEGVRSMLAAAAQIVPDDLDELVRTYPQIEAPALLLWGDTDRVVPLRIGRRLAEELPRGRLEIFPACGHVPHEEFPDSSAELLERFLSAS